MSRNSLIAILALIVLGLGAYLFSTQQTETEKVAGDDEKLKVGFVYLTNPGDHGWTYAHELGRQQLVAHFGDKIETTYVENVPEGPDASRVIRELADAGNKVIFTTSFGYMEPTIAVAKEYPDVKFDHITGYKRAENVATGNIRFYEGRYVQGVVAGLMTKSNTIGYLGAFPIPEVIQGINSFARGLRSVNKDATIKIVWLITGMILPKKLTLPRF